MLGAYKRFGRGTGLFVELRTRFASCFEMLERHVPDSGTIVDLGCGHGLFTNLLALKSGMRSVVGVDPLVNRIGAARYVARDLGIGNVSFKQDWLENGSLEDCAAVTLLDVMCYLPFRKQEELLQRCYRGLRPGGVLIIKDADRSPAWKYCCFYVEETVKTRVRILFGSRVWDDLYSRGFYVPESATFSESLQARNWSVRVLRLDRGSYQPHVAYVCRKRPAGGRQAPAA